MPRNIITKRGQFFVKFNHAGKTYQSRGFPTESDAVAWRDTAKANLAQGKPAAPPRPATPKRKTLGLRVAPHAHAWIREHKQAIEALAHVNVDLTSQTETFLKGVDKR